MQQVLGLEHRCSSCWSQSLGVFVTRSGLQVAVKKLYDATESLRPMIRLPAYYPDVRDAVNGRKCMTASGKGDRPGHDQLVVGVVASGRSSPGTGLRGCSA